MRRSLFNPYPSCKTGLFGKLQEREKIMIEKIHDLGIKSEYAYVGGFASIALSFTSWLISRGKPDHSRAQSDRWGIFVGHWAPTFFAIGIALRLEEKK